MHRYIGLLLAAIKWPVALLSVAYLPAATQVFFSETTQLFVSNSNVLNLLLVGVLSYSLLWLVMIRRARINWLATLEHEITHSFFALLTLNKVTGLRATLRDGGHMTYKGTPNWLIQTAPYFFPTLSFGLLIPILIIPSFFSEILMFAMGVSLAYHMFSTWQETHLNQTDFKEAGFAFVLCFLPAANLFFYMLCIHSLAELEFALVPTIKSIYGSTWAPTIPDFF